MGSPSAIVSFGLGSWGSVNEVVTLGYGSSVATVVTITDIGMEWTLPTNLMDWNLPINRMDHTLPNNTMDYSLPGKKPA